MPNKILTPVGTKYSVDHDDNASFTDIGGVSAIVDPGLSREAVEVTDLDDTVGQNLPSPVLEVGDLKLTVFWDEADTAGQGLLEDLLVAGTTSIDHQITLPLASGTITKTYSGWVKELGEVNYEVKGVVSREVTIECNGTATVA